MQHRAMEPTQKAQGQAFKMKRAGARPLRKEAGTPLIKRLGTKPPKPQQKAKRRYLLPKTRCSQTRGQPQTTEVAASPYKDGGA